MSDLSARLDLPLIKPSQAQKHVTHNEALQLLDALVQTVVEETGAETPPFEPVAGQLFALGPAPTGDWAGEGGKLALRVAEAWLFLTPREGWRVWDRAAGRYRVHDGAAWTDVAMDLDNLEGVGIGTTPDATNRLAVASPASLFTHAGAGHQVKVNKAADTDTASLLFQSGFTGHAEMGLAGGNDWSIKVSPDGSSWTEALVIDNDTGVADLFAGATIDGNVSYHRGNIAGTVSQSGGTPTGAVIERGSNANGAYVRFADGTQMCWQTMTATYQSGSELHANWTFPAAFDAAPVVTASRDSTGSATPSNGDVQGAPRMQSLGTGSVKLAVTRMVGTTDFQNGDTLEFYAKAIGSWF